MFRILEWRATCHPALVAGSEHSTRPRKCGVTSTLAFIGLMIMLIIFLYSSPTFALETDKNQKLFIVADSSIYNYKTGVKIYMGHVKVDQGTSHLLADKLITRDNAKHQIREAIAYGLETRAHYWTVPQLNDPEMHGYASIIKYYPIESNVILEQNATVTQAENSFQGQLIHYNINNQIITVPASQNGRAVLVYNPDKKS